MAKACGVEMTTVDIVQNKYNPELQCLHFEATSSRQNAGFTVTILK